MKGKLLIVEDDRNYRYAIQETIPWEQEGFEIVGEAIHGRQAIEFLSTHPVDIVLTDMSMPLMNGVELTRYIKKEYPRVVVIALSAYDDFQFVKESLKYGAKDYILKQDLKPDEMIRVVKEAWQQKLAEDNTVNEERHRRHILRKILRGENLCQKETEFFSELFLGKTLFLVSTSIGDADNPVEAQTQYKLPVLYQLEDHMGNLILVCEAHKTIGENACMEELRKNAALFSKVLGSENRVYVSWKVDSLQILKVCYQQLLELIGLKIYFPDVSLFFYEDYEGKIAKRNLAYNYPMEELQPCQEEEELRRSMENMLRQVTNNLPGMESLNQNFVLFCERYINSVLTGINRWNEVQFYDGLNRLNTLRDKAEYSIKTIVEQWQRASFYRGKSPEILKAIAFIRQHYGEDITLTRISREVGLSENYFSNVFKVETGENLIPYISRIRIEKAKQLLDTTNKKVYEIAEEIGFKNATYFSTSFRKITGMSITDYKNR